ncbi:acyltransferase [Neisseriaceae bacterium ESL0693]|nr:acyltransferase [Neisseriaceae bacterium ESL0693]
MKKIIWLDATRAIAIILVVFTHAHENASISNNILVSVFYSIDRLGVPLFFMISGGLILPKLYNTDIFTFYKKRIPQFIILLIVWSTLTNVVKYYIDGATLTESFIQGIHNNGIYPSDHKYAIQMWFMYTIIELYLIAPFLAKLLPSLSNKEILIFICLCIFFNQFKLTGSFFGGDWGALYKIGTDFTGSYLVYFLLGYLIIHRHFLTDKSLLLYLLMILVPTILLVYIDYRTNKINGDLHWYGNSLFILISSIGLLLLIKRIFDNKSSHLLNTISKYSFGIYLCHYIFIYIAVAITGLYFTTISPEWKLLVYLLFPLIISLLFTYIMTKNKVTKYFVS